MAEVVAERSSSLQLLELPIAFAPSTVSAAVDTRTSAVVERRLQLRLPGPFDHSIRRQRAKAPLLAVLALHQHSKDFIIKQTNINKLAISKNTE